MKNEVRIACEHPSDRVACASLARKFARDARFTRDAAAAIGICVAELVSNAVRHGGGGTLELRVLEAPASGVEVTVRDHGPGVADPALAVRDGWSQGRQMDADSSRSAGLGTGLGTVMRLMDEATIESPSEGGTVVIARKFRG